VTEVVSAGVVARDLVLWVARRDFRGLSGEHRDRQGAPRPDITALALLAGLDPWAGTPLLPWEQAQVVAGVRLPADYRAFVDLFGRGELRGELGIVTPRSLPGQPLGVGAVSRMINNIDKQTGTVFRQLREDPITSCPFPVYPEPGGLLHWGGNYNGDHCFWLTEGDDPDHWPVVVWLRGWLADGWHRYDMGMARFLLLALSGEDDTLNKLWAGSPDVPVWVPSGESA
jgi:hypothetical protein